MSLPRATSRLDLVRRFRELGWEGPYSGTNHQFMSKAERKVRIPNPHSGDIGVGLLSVILEHAGIAKDEWTGSS